MGTMNVFINMYNTKPCGQEINTAVKMHQSFQKSSLLLTRVQCPWLVLFARFGFFGHPSPRNQHVSVSLGKILQAL